MMRDTRTWNTFPARISHVLLLGIKSKDEHTLNPIFVIARWFVSLLFIFLFFSINYMKDAFKRLQTMFSTYVHARKQNKKNFQIEIVVSELNWCLSRTNFIIKNPLFRTNDSMSPADRASFELCKMNYVSSDNDWNHFVAMRESA